MDPRGHESDPVAFMRPDGDPKITRSPHAYFHQVFFGGVVRFPPPEPLPAVACSCDWGAALVLGTCRASSPSCFPPSAQGHMFGVARQDRPDGAVAIYVVTARELCDPARELS